MNGGKTLTHMPLEGSTVINAGDDDIVPKNLTNDQRGTPYQRIFDGTVDLGSIEVQVLPDLMFEDSFEDP